MNAPLLEIPGLGGLCLEDSRLTTDVIHRRILLFHSDSPRLGPAYQELKMFQKRYQLRGNEGLTYPVAHPAHPGYAILAWSSLHQKAFIWADEGFVFNSSLELKQWQKMHPEEEERYVARMYLACDAFVPDKACHNKMIDQAGFPADQVVWKTLLLLKRGI